MKNKKKVGGLLGAKIRWENKMKMFATALLVAVAGIWFFSDPVSAGVATMAMAAPIGIVAKMKKKAEEGDVELSEGEIKFLELIEEAFSEFSTGKIDEAELDKIISDVKDKLKDELGSKVTEMETTIAEINKEVKKMRDKGIKLGGASPIEKAVDAILSHQKVQDFILGKSKTSGKIALKDIVSLENNYDGNILISQQTNRVESEVAERKVNLRDVIMTDTGDPAFPSITYTRITQLDRNAATVSENGVLPESSFKVEEVTDETKRIGTHLNISKRLLKSRVYLRSYLINRLPKWVRMAEDFQILFGDGTGENLKGVAKRALNITDWLTGNIVEGVAGDVADVSTYDGGEKTQITFGRAFPKIEEGQLITFTGAPAGSVLLSANMLHKANDRTIVLDVAFASLTAAEIADLAFTVKNNFYNQVEDPNMADAIKAIFAILTYGEYTPTAISLNPSTVFEIETLKDTTGRNLDLIVTGNDGRKRVAGRLIHETTAVPPGYFLAGDYMNGAALVDYSSLEVEFAEDIYTKLRNSVTVIAQEEVILQVFNPFAFAYGRLDEVLNAIRK